MARPGVSPGRQHQNRARLFKLRHQPARADAVENGDRRHVERLLQRLRTETVPVKLKLKFRGA